MWRFQNKGISFVVDKLNEKSEVIVVLYLNLTEKWVKESSISFGDFNQTEVAQIRQLSNKIREQLQQGTRSNRHFTDALNALNENKSRLSNPSDFIQPKRIKSNDFEDYEFKIHATDDDMFTDEYNVSINNNTDPNEGTSTQVDNFHSNPQLNIQKSKMITAETPKEPRIKQRKINELMKPRATSSEGDLTRPLDISTEMSESNRNVLIPKARGQDLVNQIMDTD